MPESPAPGVCQVVLDWTTGGGDARNVLHYQLNGGENYTPAAVDDLISQVQDTIATSFGATQHSSVKLDQVIGTPKHVVPGIPQAIGSTYAGTSAAQPLPNNVTTAMTLRSETGGRSGRGRIYHVGMVATQITGDKLVTASASALITAYQALRVQQDTPGLIHQLVVLSRYFAKAQRAAAIAYPITTITNDGVLDSQRRRLTGRGR